MPFRNRQAASSTLALGSKICWVQHVRSTRKRIQTLLKVGSGDDHVHYLCYLLTGLRDKEMRHLTWRDIDFRTHVIRVTRKPLYGFKPKNKEEREVPVPASLIAAASLLEKPAKTPKPIPAPLAQSSACWAPVAGSERNPTT